MDLLKGDLGMAKVVFFQQLAHEWLGVMYLSSMLKHHGHQCEIYVERLEKGNIVQKSLSEHPDLFAFSCLTSDYHWALKKAEAIKKHSNSLIMMGGTHITLNPEEAILNPDIDIICQGEGEYPISELAEAIDRKEDYSRIKNLWVKKNGTVVRNEIRDLIEDLDSLPFPDRELYSRYPFFRKKGKRPLHLGRGCPYDCSYCHNARKKILFYNKGRYVRWRSIEGVIGEIEEIRGKNFVRVLHFIDDSFVIDREWLKAFLKRLSEMEGPRLAIQFNMRADIVTEDLCEAFQDYGVQFLRIRIAVECGDEEYRRHILKKELTNKKLLKAADIFHKYKIGFITYNMVGLPGETLDQALETLRLNLKLRPNLTICFIYQPYPGTDLCNYAVEKGFLTESMRRRLGTPEYQGFYQSKSVLCQKDIGDIMNLQKIFGTVVKFPFLFPYVRGMVRSRILTPFLRLIYKVFVYQDLFLRQLKDKY
jgi:radical SAM superfamily enzyme YgiQ (UPF0313 family)